MKKKRRRRRRREGEEEEEEAKFKVWNLPLSMDLWILVWILTLSMEF